MKLKLVLVPVPVSDIDRAKSFYVEKVGFKVKWDVRSGAAVRVVQLTPPGSACSIVFGTGVPHIKMRAGSLRGLHLAMKDIVQTRKTLTGREIKVTKIVNVGDKDSDTVRFTSFSDPTATRGRCFSSWPSLSLLSTPL